MTYSQNKMSFALIYNLPTYYLLVPILLITSYLSYIPTIYYLAYLIN
jgi:hypothetical protein